MRRAGCNKIGSIVILAVLGCCIVFFDLLDLNFANTGLTDAIASPCIRHRSSVCQRLPKRLVQSGITLPMLAAAQNRSRVLRLQILGGEIFASPVALERRVSDSDFRVSILVQQLRDCIARFGPTPDVEFLVSMRDSAPTGVEFGYGRQNGDGFMCPSYQFWDRGSAFGGVNADNWAKKSTYIQLAARALAWMKGWAFKSPHVFWRGSCTRPIRGKLYEIGQQHPDLFDVKFVHDACTVGQAVDNAKIDLSGLFGQNLQHKFLVDVDGNGWSSRFAMLLEMGGVIFKATDFEEWYYTALRESIDYVRVSGDLSDLVKLVTVYQRDDAAAWEVARNARAFARSHLSYTNALAYWHDLLIEYAKLQRFVPVRRQGFVQALTFPLLADILRPSTKGGSAVAAVRRVWPGLPLPAQISRRLRQQVADQAPEPRRRQAGTGPSRLGAADAPAPS
jgi:hypothetical protein